jgi:tetrahydrodipicolinate N-succinyltransferase
LIHTLKEFEDFVANFKTSLPVPIGFGIYKPDLDIETGHPNSAQFLIANYNENVESCAILVAALGTLKLNKDQLITQKYFPISDLFLEMCFNYFEPIKEDTTNRNYPLYKVIKALAEPGVNYKEFSLYMPFSLGPSPDPVENYYKLYISSLRKASLAKLQFNKDILPLYWSGDYPYRKEYLETNLAALKSKGAYPIIDYVSPIPLFHHHLPYPSDIGMGPNGKIDFGAYIGPGSYVEGHVNYLSHLAGSNQVYGDIVNYHLHEKAFLGLNSRLHSDTTNYIGKNTTIGNGVTIDNLNIEENCKIESGLNLESDTVVEVEDAVLQKLIGKSGKGTAYYQDMILARNPVDSGSDRLRLPFAKFQELKFYRLTLQKVISAI